jgi:3-oxoacyl-[acyl-carrier-protein] synthase II
MLFPRLKPSEPPRVVVTGAGIVTSLGIGWDANAASFRVGASNFKPMSLFDVSRQRVKLAAQAELPASPPASRLSARQAGRMDRAARMLHQAADEAWRQAGWVPAPEIALIVGTTAGGMTAGEAYFREAARGPGARRGQPTRAMMYQANTQARMTADALGAEGPIRIVSNACASGADAIGHAWESIRRGESERVLTGGYDAHTELVFAGFDSLQLLTRTTCRPFDATRDGMLLGEGAAVLALEALPHALARGATILGEVAGYGQSVDRHHLTQPHPAGDAALASMTLACAAAGVAPGQIDYVNAHGTGTVLNDAAEAAAINRWAGARAATLPVSSVKGSVGHLLGAAGAVEAVACLMALNGQWLPPQPGLTQKDAACGFPVVAQPQSASLQYVLSNSFGFGGVNATLIFRRWS